MMNQRQWLVDVSRAKEEFRMFTDCPELVEQQIVRSEEQETALSLVKKVQAIEVDLRAAKNSPKIQSPGR